MVANSLSVDEASCIVSWLLLESLAHTTLRINKTFRDATRNHIKRNVRPILAPLRAMLFFRGSFFMDSYSEALTRHKTVHFRGCRTDDLSKAFAIGAFTNVNLLYFCSALTHISAPKLAKAFAREGSSQQHLSIKFTSKAAMKAFAKCITKGDMPSLRGLVVRCGYAGISTVSKVSLLAACTSRGIKLSMRCQ